jgi:hypothetical protein
MPPTSFQQMDSMMHTVFLETALNSTTVKSILKPSIITDDITVNTGLRLKRRNGVKKILYLDETCPKVTTCF